VEQDGTLTSLDASTATQPSLSSTWFICLLRHIWVRIRGGAPQPSEDVEEDNNEIDADDTSESSGELKLTARSRIGDRRVQNGTMIAGRRRNRGKKRV
jgi:hypothetical protein